VLLTRVGGFYELYFEQADEYGPLLNLKVSQKKTNVGPVSMVLFCARTVPLSCLLVF
jgi:DNA mismatch repair ATPase MutS